MWAYVYIYICVNVYIRKKNVHIYISFVEKKFIYHLLIKYICQIHISFVDMNKGDSCGENAKETDWFEPCKTTVTGPNTVCDYERNICI